MTSATTTVQEHYGRGGLLGRIEAALRANGEPVEKFAVEALYPIDQLHSRQLAATKDHLARLQLDESKRVLDVGSGIGGPARYMAATFGCRVTGIDLTEEFVAVARELTRRCGLSQQVAFERGDALAMPFADQSFDAASCLHVAMNIPDKRRLLAETSRVLRRGARLVWSVVVLGGIGEPLYPVPWARDAGGSFLVAPDTLREAFADAGFAVLEWSDETKTNLDHAAALRAAGRPALGSLANQIVLGSDITEAVTNLNRNFVDGRLRVLFILAERT
jgi:SAM-dependent methyltransferase